MIGDDDSLERELESFLTDDSRVAALYRRLPKDEPDARLDAAILAQARAAGAPRRTRPRWLPAMSAAAALVIVAGLAYRVAPHVWNERSAVSEKAEQNVAAPSPAPPSSPRDAPAAPAQTDAAATQPPPPATLSSNVAPLPARVARERPAPSDESGADARAMESQQTASGSVAAQTAQLKKSQSSERDRTDSISAAAPRRAAELHESPMASPPRLDAAPAPAPETIDMAPAPAKGLAQPAALALPEAAKAVSSSNAAATPAPAKPVPSTQDVEVALYPEHWISDIRQMLKDGRRDDAIKNRDAFRKRYPDYKLPDDLRDLK